MENNKKIILLIRSLTTGGCETQLESIAVGLRSKGMLVTVFVFYRGGETFKSLKSKSIDVISIDKKSRWDIWSMFRLIKKFREIKPDILYGFLTESNLILALWKILGNKGKVVWGIRAASADTVLRSSDNLVKWGFTLAKWLSWLPDMIISNSQKSRDVHVSLGFSSRNFQIVANGVDLDRFVVDNIAGQRKRREWGIPDDYLAIGYVARLDPIKDHLCFLEAACLFKTTTPKVKFVIVGDGEANYVQHLRRTTSEKNLTNDVVWIGNETDICAVYNGLDINTLCSKSESFPNTLIEAMACSTPCVTTDVGDAGSIAGNHAIIVPTQDPSSIATAWRWITDEKHQHIRFIRARSRIEARFSSEHMINRTYCKIVRLLK